MTPSGCPAPFGSREPRTGVQSDCTARTRVFAHSRAGPLRAERRSASRGHCRGVKRPSRGPWGREFSGSAIWAGVDRGERARGAFFRDTGTNGDADFARGLVAQIVRLVTAHRAEPRPVAALQDRPDETAVSARKRSSARRGSQRSFSRKRRVSSDRSSQHLVKLGLAFVLICQRPEVRNARDPKARGNSGSEYCRLQMLLEET